MTPFLFISPHSKKIGETYILPNLIEVSADDREARVYLFNVSGEWDHLPKSQVIENPVKFITRLAPDIERLNPWLNYRIWLIFVSLSIVVGLPIVFWLNRDIKGLRPITVARMATSSVSISRFFIPKNRMPILVASMAGVPMLNLYRRKFLKYFYSNFDFIVSPCHDMVPYLDDLLGLKKSAYTVIPNPIFQEFDRAKFLENLQKRDFSSKDEISEFKILAVGRLTRQKGFDTLIKAVAQSSLNMTLDIFGEGENKSELVKLTEDLDVSHIVNFLGYRNDPFSGCEKYDLFVMPSRWEGPGHTIMEALSYAIPSIVSDCKFGPSETVGGGNFGLVFKVDDVSDLKLKIDYAFCNYPKFHHMLKGAERDLHRYSAASVWDNWKRRFLD